MFKETARELGADENEKHWEERLKKIAKQKTESSHGLLDALADPAAVIPGKPGTIATVVICGACLIFIGLALLFFGH